MATRDRSLCVNRQGRRNSTSSAIVWARSSMLATRQRYPSHDFLIASSEPQPPRRAADSPAPWRRRVTVDASALLAQAHRPTAELTRRDVARLMLSVPAVEALDAMPGLRRELLAVG